MDTHVWTHRHRKSKTQESIWRRDDAVSARVYMPPKPQKFTAGRPNPTICGHADERRSRMDDYLEKISDNGGLIQIPGAGDLMKLGKPFLQTIYLTSCEVAGTIYAERIEWLLAGLKEEDPLKLAREPKNPYDEFAIRVDTIKGEKLGYIPKAINHIPARLMDAGKLITARVQRKLDAPHRFRLALYLED